MATLKNDHYILLQARLCCSYKMLFWAMSKTKNMWCVSALGKYGFWHLKELLPFVYKNESKFVTFWRAFCSCYCFRLHFNSFCFQNFKMVANHLLIGSLVVLWSDAMMSSNIGCWPYNINTGFTTLSIISRCLYWDVYL